MRRQLAMGARSTARFRLAVSALRTRLRWPLQLARHEARLQLEHGRPCAPMRRRNAMTGSALFQVSTPRPRRMRALAGRPKRGQRARQRARAPRLARRTRGGCRPPARLSEPRPGTRRAGMRQRQWPAAAVPVERRRDCHLSSCQAAPASRPIGRRPGPPGAADTQAGALGAPSQRRARLDRRQLGAEAPQPGRGRPGRCRHRRCGDGQRRCAAPDDASLVQSRMIAAASLRRVVAVGVVVVDHVAQDTTCGAPARQGRLARCARAPPGSSPARGRAWSCC